MAATGGAILAFLTALITMKKPTLIFFYRRLPWLRQGNLCYKANVYGMFQQLLFQTPRDWSAPQIRVAEKYLRYISRIYKYFQIIIWMTDIGYLCQNHQCPIGIAQRMKFAFPLSVVSKICSTTDIQRSGKDDLQWLPWKCRNWSTGSVLRYQHIIKMVSALLQREWIVWHIECMKTSITNVKK